MHTYYGGPGPVLVLLCLLRLHIHSLISKSASWPSGTAAQLHAPLSRLSSSSMRLI